MSALGKLSDISVFVSGHVKLMGSQVMYGHTLGYNYVCIVQTFMCWLFSGGSLRLWAITVYKSYPFYIPIPIHIVHGNWTAN